MLVGINGARAVFVANIFERHIARLVAMKLDHQTALGILPHTAPSRSRPITGATHAGRIGTQHKARAKRGHIWIAKCYQQIEVGAGKCGRGRNRLDKWETAIVGRSQLQRILVDHNLAAVGLRQPAIWIQR